MSRELLQQALDALETICDPANGSRPRENPFHAIEALRAYLAAPPAAPAPDLIPPDALFVCGQMGANVTRVRAKSAAPPAAPAPVAPDGMVLVPREPTEDMIQAAAGAWEGSEGGLHNAFAAALRGGIAASPAAPVVREPLTDEQILRQWDRISGITESGKRRVAFARAIEAHHGICTTGGGK